jgi:hypothetical protein
VFDSPRIARFIAETEVDAQAALGALRKDLEVAQGPLVEDVPGTREVRVTFVYIGDVDSVSLSCQLFPAMPPKTVEGMELVAGTDVWYATTLADPRTSTSYQFQLSSTRPRWATTSRRSWGS